MTQPQDKMRAEFEAFVKSEEYDLDLQTDAPGGRYIKGCAGFAWDFWQAACAQQSDQSQQDALDGARYRWLARKVGAHGVIDGWAFSFPTHLTIPAPPIAMYDPEKALGESIDALIAAQGASNV